MTEGDRQLVIDDGTLAAVRPVAYSKDALGGTIMTAHPHFDFERGKVLNVATGFGAGGVISIYEHAPDGAAARRRRLVAHEARAVRPHLWTDAAARDSGCASVYRYAVKMLWSSKGYIDHFDWQPQDGTRLVVIDRSSGEAREHVTEAFFAFHTVNAFERATRQCSISSPIPTRASWHPCAPIG